MKLYYVTASAGSGGGHPRLTVVPPNHPVAIPEKLAIYDDANTGTVARLAETRARPCKIKTSLV